MSILAVTNALLRNRWLIVGATLLVTVIAVGRALLAPRKYAASASFMLAGARVMSPLSGLAAQFGVSVPGTNLQQSPDFYVALVHTRVVQDDVLDADYAFQTPTGPYSGTLLDYYGGRSMPLPDRRELALRSLGGQIETAMDLKTGVVTLTVRSFSPSLAADVARNLLSALDRFNRMRAENQSSRDREFMKEQVDSAAADMHATEDRLEAFQERNRDYAGAPRLAVEYQRLLREVAMQQQLYSSVSLAYAQARMDATRDNPTLATVEPPETPARPERRHLGRVGVLALIAGLTLGLFLAFAREHVARTRRLHPDEEKEFGALRTDIRQDVRGLLRLLGGRGR